VLLGLEKSTFAKNKNCYEMTRGEWIRRLDDMQGVGLNLLFIIGGVNEGLRRKAISSPDLLEFLFSECDRRRMEVIISASCWDDWQVGGIDISREMKLVEEITNEVYARYGLHPSFSGWYLPYECNMLGGRYGKLLCDLYRAGVEKCKSLTPHLPVSISPFFVPDTVGKCMEFEYREPAEYVDFWSNALSYAKIDILALQDNGGQHLSCFTEKDTRPFIEAFAKACSNTGTQFWGNVETGEFPVADLDDFVRRFGAKEDVNNPEFRSNWRAVPIDTLIRKLELISPFSVRNVSWGYFEFYDPLAGELNRAAYEDYRQYTQNLISMIKGE
jgi:hypothetical protein